MNKKSIFRKTSTWVFVYAIAALVSMLFQAFIAACIKFDIHFHGTALSSLVNGNFQMPMSNIGWMWCSLCAVYCGVDRAAYTIRSSQLESGKIDVGDPNMLRRVIVVAGLLAFVACLCNGFVEADFDLNSWSSAFGSSVVLYVGGMKATKMVQYVDGKIDSDGDGIADEEQEVDESGNLVSGKKKE